MNDLLSILHREIVYIWYYFDLQLRQIFWYWVLGMAIGSAISVFAKNKIHGLFAGLQGKKLGLLGIIPACLLGIASPLCIPACLLGIASPLCMYGTIPIAASFRKQGMREDWLAAFMMASILLNPQLIIYSAALGTRALAVRIVSCFLCGCAAGLLVFVFYREKEFFNFEGFSERSSRDTHPNLLIRYRGLGCADGRHDRCASLCLRWRNDSSIADLACGRNEHGLCRGVYDHGARHEDH